MSGQPGGGCRLLQTHVCNMTELPSASHWQGVTYRQMGKGTWNAYSETLQHRTWTLGGQKWGFLLCFQLRVIPRKEKRKPQSPATQGGWAPGTVLWACHWGSAALYNPRKPVSVQKCNSQSDHKSSKLKMWHRRGKCSDKWGKNGGLCAREKITGSSEELFISMRKDREVTKTTHLI